MYWFHFYPGMFHSLFQITPLIRQCNYHVYQCRVIRRIKSVIFRIIYFVQMYSWFIFLCLAWKFMTLLFFKFKNTSIPRHLCPYAPHGTLFLRPHDLALPFLSCVDKALVLFRLFDIPVKLWYFYFAPLHYFCYTCICTCQSFSCRTSKHLSHIREIKLRATLKHSDRLEHI